MTDEAYVGPCSVCGAVADGEWPHPLGEPCPIRLRESDAYIAKLEAEASYWSRAEMTMKQRRGR